MKKTRAAQPSGFPSAVAGVARPSRLPTAARVPVRRSPGAAGGRACPPAVPVAVAPAPLRAPRVPLVAPPTARQLLHRPHSRGSGVSPPWPPAVGLPDALPVPSPSLESLPLSPPAFRPRAGRRHTRCGPCRAVVYDSGLNKEREVGLPAPQAPPAPLRRLRRRPPCLPPAGPGASAAPGRERSVSEARRGPCAVEGRLRWARPPRPAPSPRKASPSLPSSPRLPLRASPAPGPGHLGSDSFAVVFFGVRVCRVR